MAMRHWSVRVLVTDGESTVPLLVWPGMNEHKLMCVSNVHVAASRAVSWAKLQGGVNPRQAHGRTAWPRLMRNMKVTIEMEAR